MKSLAFITEQARLYPGSAIGPCTHQSLGFPVRQPAELKIAFLFCRAEVIEPKGDLSLWHPRLIAFHSPVTGRFEELRAIQPKDLGIRASGADPAGKYLAPPERTGNDFLGASAKFYQAFDTIFPAFQKADPAPSGDILDAIREFGDAFDRLAEQPLVPYYRKLGRDFFGWIDRVRGATRSTGGTEDGR